MFEIRRLGLSLGSQVKRNLSTSTPKKSSIASKIGIVLGVSGLGVLGFVTYDRFAELPEEFRGLNFPFLSRWYIRRALCPVTKLEETARLLDLAMQNVLNSGLGSASPESTALVLYLTRRYMKEPNPSIADLEAAYQALTYKPHVGEAVREERARLMKSFEVAHLLCKFYSQGPHADPGKVRHYASRSLEFIDNGPKYLIKSFENHPLRSDFIKFSK